MKSPRMKQKELGRVLVLHQGSIPGVLYDLQGLVGVIPECRVQSNPWKTASYSKPKT